MKGGYYNIDGVGACLVYMPDIYLHVTQEEALLKSHYRL